MESELWWGISWSKKVRRVLWIISPNAIGIAADAVAQALGVSASLRVRG